MAGRIRGQEVTVQVIVDGDLKKGSFAKTENFKLTPRWDLTDSDFLGEKTSEPDYQFHGWDVSFMCHDNDSKVFDFVFGAIEKERLGLPPPVVNIVAMYKYRDPSLPSKTVVLENVLLKLDDKDHGGRKDYIKNSFTGKCKRVTPLS